MDQAEASGKTVDDALRRALAILGATRDEVEFVVLDEGRKGGLFGRGSKDAMVRVERIANGQAGSGSMDPPDTRIPRGAQGRQGGGPRRDDARPPQRAPSGDRNDRGGRDPGRDAGRDRGPRPPRDGDRGASRGAGSRGGMTQFEAATPKLTDADFLKPRPDGGGGDGGSPAPETAEAPRSGAPRGQRPPREPRPEGDRPPRAPRPPRDDDRGPREPRSERRSRDDEPQVDPDINAEEVDFAAHIVDDMLRMWDIPAGLTIREPITAGDGLGHVRAVIDISGDDLGLLIGRRGDTLLNLQYLVNLIVGRRFPGKGGVSIDVEHYRHRREETVVSLAMRMADRVRQTGSPITLEPMSAGERRLVHIALAEDPELETNSIGDGDNRKVVISARR